MQPTSVGFIVGTPNQRRHEFWWIRHPLRWRDVRGRVGTREL